MAKHYPNHKPGSVRVPRLSQWVYFKDRGWCIFCGVKNKNAASPRYLFVDGNTKQQFEASREYLSTANMKEGCFCRFIRYDNLDELRRNDDVYVINNQQLKFATFKFWKNDKLVVWLNDHEKTPLEVEPSLVVAFYHDFRPIKGVHHTTQSCNRCGALTTMPYKMA